MFVTHWVPTLCTLVSTFYWHILQNIYYISQIKKLKVPNSVAIFLAILIISIFNFNRVHRCSHGVFSLILSQLVILTRCFNAPQYSFQFHMKREKKSALSTSFQTLLNKSHFYNTNVP